MTEVSNNTKGRSPRVPFDKIKINALGKNYSLSVVFVSALESQRINKEYRKKDKPTNILSFSYSKGSGEIVLCPEVVIAEAESHGLPYSQYATYLFIHGLMHLRGFDHSEEMERREIKLRKKYLPKSFVRP